MENILNKKSILKSMVEEKLECFFYNIETELKSIIRKVESDFQEAIDRYNRVSIKLARLNKINPSLKLSLLEKIADSKIVKINEIKEKYTDDLIIKESFDSDNYRIEEAFCSDDFYYLINENILSDMDRDLEEAKCDVETYYRIDDLFNKIQSKQRQVA